MTRVGISRTTGQVLIGWPHCAQSIGDVVSTLVGERVEARTYGAVVPALQDRPGNTPSVVLHFSAIANALYKWEPGYRLRHVGVLELAKDGVAGFGLAGDFFPDGHLGDYSRVETDRNITLALGQGGVLA